MSEVDLFGVPVTILRNSARCLVCRQEVVSTHRHDFVTCPCGNLSVDGGLVYLRRVYRIPDSIEDTSVVHAEDDVPNEDVPVAPVPGPGHHH